MSYSLTYNPLHELFVVVFKGGGRGVKRKPSSIWLLDALNRLDVWLFGWFDGIDARHLFGGRSVRTADGRVRSRYERWIADVLRDHGIRYAYERRLAIRHKGKTYTFRPDFYLPKYGAYIECWGLADTDEAYGRGMRFKLALYKKHGIRLISIYPRHFKQWRLEENLAGLFEKATGRPFP